jgi:hypothetical protein
MSKYMMLADLEAQHINGGWGSRYRFSSTSMKSVTTHVGQTNTANNLGLGLLFGSGNATSEQVNIANVTTILA